MKILPSEIVHCIEQRLARLYGGDQLPRLSARLAQLLGRHPGAAPPAPWTQADAILATFGDSVTVPGEKPLRTLRRWLDEHTGRTFSCLHLLPFFPANPGEEYAVGDHRQVDPRLGEWKDVAALGQGRRLMFDLLLSHVSRDSAWFRDYVDGISPARGYFVALDPTTDLGRVESPCDTPILTCIQTRRGERHLWTTYGCEQFDLDFRNPDVLFEFLEIMLAYVQHGAELLQLEGVSYLWKDPATCSVNLPEDHELVRLFREVLAAGNPGVLLACDTPGYFGGGDECQLLYSQPLGALLVHALLSGDAGHLNVWLENLPAPPPGCAYINQTDDANGIALRNAAEHLPEAEYQRLVDWLTLRGAHITPYRRGNALLPFEANLSYFDAFCDPGRPPGEHHIARFLCAQTIALALRGLPAIHFPTLMAAASDRGRVEATGNPRAANRHRWQWTELAACLADPTAPATRVCHELLRRLQLRGAHSVFHPDAPQFPLALPPGLFGLRRTTPDGRETLAAVSNLGSQTQTFLPGELIPDLLHYPVKQELLTGLPLEGAPLTLEAYQTAWLLAACPQTS